MKTINVTVFATESNTMCKSREEFDALVTTAEKEFYASFAERLSNRIGSDGEDIKAEVVYKLIEDTNPNIKASGGLDEFSVMITDNTGAMRYTEIDEWERSIEDMIDDIEA